LLKKEKLEKELNRIIPEIIKLGVEKGDTIWLIKLWRCSYKSSDIDIIVVQKTGKSFWKELKSFTII